MEVVECDFIMGIPILVHCLAHVHLVQEADTAQDQTLLLQERELIILFVQGECQRTIQGLHCLSHARKTVIIHVEGCTLQDMLMLIGFPLMESLYHLVLPQDVEMMNLSLRGPNYSALPFAKD